MATITSTSTDTEITAAYLGNCGYREDDDSTKAAAFVTVVTAMMIRGMTLIRHADEEMRFSIADLRELIKDARQFIAQKAGTQGGVVHHSIEYFRE